MMTRQASSQLEVNIWSEIVAAASGAVVAALAAAGVWWRGRSDRETKRIEGKTSASVAQITAGSTQELKALDILLERVQNLEQHNDTQDKRINQLVEEKAALAANLTIERERNGLLVEQNGLLREEIRILSLRLGEQTEPITVEIPGKK